MSDSLALVQTFFAAYRARDLALVFAVVDPDILWHTPGHHRLAGTKRGIEAVIDYLDALLRTTFQVEMLAIAQSGSYVLEHHRSFSTVAPVFETTWCAVFRCSDRHIVEVTNHCRDQDAVDRFFSAVVR